MVAWIVGASTFSFSRLLRSGDWWIKSLCGCLYTVCSTNLFHSKERRQMAGLDPSTLAAVVSLVTNKPTGFKLISTFYRSMLILQYLGKQVTCTWGEILYSEQCLGTINDLNRKSHIKLGYATNKKSLLIMFQANIYIKLIFILYSESSQQND